MKIKSIMSTDKRCFVCGSTQNIHLHHVFFGTGLRKISDDNGFTCYLCGHHHNQSKIGVHNNRELDLILKRRCQKIYETYHTREEFMQLIGRNYLD
jgi:hypothetical protein